MIQVDEATALHVAMEVVSEIGVNSKPYLTSYWSAVYSKLYHMRERLIKSDIPSSPANIRLVENDQQQDRSETIAQTKEPEQDIVEEDKPVEDDSLDPGQEIKPPQIVGDRIWVTDEEGYIFEPLMIPLSVEAPNTAILTVGRIEDHGKYWVGVEGSIDGFHGRLEAPANINDKGYNTFLQAITAGCQHIEDYAVYAAKQFQRGIWAVEGMPREYDENETREILSLLKSYHDVITSSREVFINEKNLQSVVAGDDAPGRLEER